MPIISIPRLILGLLSWALVGVAVYLLWSWYQGADLIDRDGVVRHLSGEPWRLYVGLGLLAWSAMGRFIVLLAMPAGENEPREERQARTWWSPQTERAFTSKQSGHGALQPWF